MGHKVNPIVLRIGLHRTWTSRWFAPSKQQFVAYLQEDIKIRALMKKELEAAAVSCVEIERSPERLRVIVHTARPGVLIGRRGENIQRLQESVQRIVGTQKQLKLDYVEVQNPSADAQLIAESIAFQLQKRVAYRRAMKRALQQAMESGAKGAKIVCRGRLAGSEMTRRESYRDGRVPLSTFRANIEFGTATAHTTAGCIGLKVWVYKGDVVRLKAPTESEPDYVVRSSARRAAPAETTAPAGTK